MALIYDSSHSGQEIDAAVEAVQTTIPSQLTQIGSKIGDLSILTTAAKNNVVAAVNEINGKVGSLATGKYYGFYNTASALPTSGNENGYAYVGATAPYSIYNGVSNGGTMSWTDSGSKISNASVADEEDITQDSNGKLSFKDRGTLNGLGYKILRGNATFESQVSAANTIYEIRYNFILSNDFTIPSGCVLRFNGGSIGGGHTLTFDNTILENAERGFTKDVVPGGTIYRNSVNVDWWQTLKISSADYTNRVSAAGTDNDTIFSNIFSWGSIKEIIFGNGIYIFNRTFIPAYYAASRVHIHGQGCGNTCLYFPQSEGLLFTRGDLGESIIEDFAIHSNRECIKFHIYASSDRYNACHGNNFKRLLLISNDGEFAFGAVWNYSSFLYGNRFEKIRYWVKEDSACFSHLAGGLGHSYFDVTDTINDFAKNSLGKSYSTIWDACSGVNAKYCNTGVGIKHIYTYKNAGKSSESLGLDAGLGIDGKQGGTLTFESCNFESYLGEFIKYETAYLDPTIEFKNCRFTTHKFADFTNKAHISVSNLRGLIGFPSQVWDDTAQAYNTSICIADRLNLSLLVEADVSMVNQSGNSVSEANEKLNSLPLYYDGKYHYFLERKKYTISDEMICKYKSIRITEYDFSNPPSSLISSIKGLPEIISFKNATDSNNTATLGLECNLARSWGDIANIAPVVLVNMSQYIITLKLWNNGSIVRLIPFKYAMIIGNGVIYPNTEIEQTWNVNFNVNVGDIIDGLKCIEKNSGIYCSAARKNNWPFSVNNTLSPTYNMFAHNGYIYLCVVKGTTASEAPEYSTTINTLTTDGTAQFLCLGKAARFIRTSGTTSQRPTLDSADEGMEYYDSTLKKKILWNGIAWTNLDGTSLDSTSTETQAE